jgi:hypothetical protein
MSATPVTSHLSAFELDSLRAGRLADARARAAREHLEACATCRSLEDGLQADQRHFAREVLPRTGPRLRARMEERERSWARRSWLVAGLVPAAALALLLVVRPGPRDPAPYRGEKGGSSSFRVVGYRDGRAFPVRSGTELNPGDDIRFLVTTRLPYLLIASIDGRGQAKVYVPYDGTGSAAVRAGQPLQLPDNNSIELDAAPGPERIFALFSRRPLEAAPVLAALKKLGARGPQEIRSTESLALAAADEQLTALLEKAQPKGQPKGQPKEQQ